MSEAHRDRLAASFESLPRGTLGDRYEVLQRTIAASQAGGQLTAGEARQLLDYLDSLMHVGHPATFSKPYLHLRRLLAFKPPLAGEGEGKWTQAQVKAAREGGRLSVGEAEVLGKALAERMAAGLMGVFGPPEVEVPLALPKLRPGEVDVGLGYRERAALERVASITMFQHGTTGRRLGEHYITVSFVGEWGEVRDGQRHRDTFDLELAHKEITG